jgi:L-alanine-DL-glutamate epimerase-like enolase superfamily enzyme
VKIENVETFHVSLPFDSGGAEGWAASGWTTLDYVLLRVDTDAGISGWGDAFGYGAAWATRAAVERMVAPAIIGRDAGDIAGIHRDLQLANHVWGRYGVTLFAISGVDIALWDIAGKAAGVPLHRLLGGARRARIPAYASLFRYANPEVVAERTRAAMAEGYRHVKLHEVREPEVRAAREAAGHGVALMVDVNCEWTPHQALQMARALAPYELYWLEEPIFPPEDFAALAALRRASGVALAAGENACTAFQFRDIIASGGVDYLQPSVTKVGGVSEMLKIITLAQTHGATLMPHSPYFGPGLLATLHLLATLPDECLAEFFYYSALPASLYGDAVRAVDGHMTVPDGPGLGVEPDLDVIREHAVAA